MPVAECQRQKGEQTLGACNLGMGVDFMITLTFNLHVSLYFK